MPEISREVRVLPYDPDWPEQYLREEARLRPVLGQNLVGLHHIGSTSVPGLCAKPIIDILAEVKSLRQVERISKQMEALGYEVMGEFGIPGRRYFRRIVDGQRTHHLHIFQAGSPGSRRHLAFRDYLREHPETAAEYGRLKTELAARHPADIAAYIDGKDPFVKRVEKQALEWDLQSRLVIQPLTPLTWDLFEELFGSNGACAGCWCMYWRLPHKEFSRLQGAGARQAMRDWLETGHVPGLVATLDGKPAGWVAFGPRELYQTLENSRLLSRVDDQPVWSLTCFFVKRPFRGRGLTAALIRAAILSVKAQGGQILEAYPVDTGEERTSDLSVFTGLASTFRALGFSEAARRSPRRPIYRLEIRL